MNKYLLPLLFLSSSAHAMDLYHYRPIEGCSLRKAIGENWQVVSPDEVGQDSFPILTSKVNTAYSNFKYQGAWYAAKTECFEMESLEAGGSGFRMKKGKFFVEPKFSFYMMTGSETGGGVASGVTVGKYSPSIGLAAKVGYYLNDHSDAFIEINRFAGSRITDFGIGTLKNDDSVISFNLGYQYFLSRFKKFLPYGGLALGYNSLSQKQVSSVGTQQYSSSGIGFILEAGVLYDLSSRIALMGALNYTIMSFSELTPASGTGTMANTMGYSHLGINLGARYHF